MRAENRTQIAKGSLLFSFALTLAASGYSQTRAARHFVCDKVYTLKQCDEELVVLKKALAKYPIADLGEWTWVLVRSEHWKLTLLTQTLDPGIPALTDLAARATFFDDALVTGASGRMSELMAIWHMGRESLLDFAIRHELGHALCNDANEMDAERVARLLKQKKPISCKAKVVANPHQKLKGAPLIAHTHEASPGHHEIPFQTYRDYLIVVQGSLGCKLRRNLIIDTGTDPSVINSRAAQELHMVGVVGRLAVHDQVVDVQQAVLPSVQIGTLRAESLPVLIRDLGFLQKDLGIRIDAVIGLDVLSLSNFSIDYTTKRIVFGAVPVSGFSVPFQSAPPWLTVRMEVNGVSLHLLLDTAASGILLFQSRVRDRLPQLISLGERKSSNMGGDFRLQRVLLATTNFGETDFGQQNAFVVEDQDDENREFDGLLGPSAIGLKQIAFDFQRRTFSWKR